MAEAIVFPLHVAPVRIGIDQSYTRSRANRYLQWSDVTNVTEANALFQEQVITNFINLDGIHTDCGAGRNPLVLGVPEKIDDYHLRYYQAANCSYFERTGSTQSRHGCFDLG